MAPKNKNPVKLAIGDRVVVDFLSTRTPDRDVGIITDITVFGVDVKWPYMSRGLFYEENILKRVSIDPNLLMKNII